MASTDHPSRLINPITSKQAKQRYRLRDPTRVSKEEQKKLDRQLELHHRAEAIKEKERKQKDLKKKQKEEKERKGRNHNGHGLATQLAGFQQFVIKMHKIKNIPVELIGNMDETPETPLWFDMPVPTIVDLIGV